MIKVIVNNQKPIVNFVGIFYLYRLILAIMPVETLSERAAYIRSINQSRYPRIAVVELNEYGFVNIIINQYNPGNRFFDKSADEFVSVKYLPVKEYTLFWR